MWQSLVNDTSFWTCTWYLVGATQQMQPWQALSAAYLYSSLEMIALSAFGITQDPALTWFAYKIAFIMGIPQKTNPWLILAILPQLTLYLDPRGFGVAIYIVAAVYLDYKWAVSAAVTSAACMALTMHFKAAPLVVITYLYTQCTIQQCFASPPPKSRQTTTGRACAQSSPQKEDSSSSQTEKKLPACDSETAYA